MKTETPQSTKGYEDDQYYFSTPRIMAESNEGYYFLSGPQRNILYYMDKKSMKAILLCNKPDCLHMDEPNMEKISQCNAYYENPMELFYNNGKLYILLNINMVNYELFSISPDGSQRKSVYAFKEPPDNIIMHRGFLYYSTNDDGTVSGQESSTSSKCALFRVPLDDMGKEPELIFTGKGIYASLLGLIGYKDKLYFAFNYYEDPEQTKLNNTLMSYDLSSGKTLAVTKDIGNFHFCNKKIYYYMRRQTWTCNMEGTDRKLLENVVGNCDADEHYLYSDTLLLKLIQEREDPGNKVERQLIIYTLEGKEIQSFNTEFTGRNFYIGGDSKWYFIQDTSKSNEYGPIHALWALDKDKLADGSAKLEKIFEFIPKVEFKGVVTQKSND